MAADHVQLIAETKVALVSAVLLSHLLPGAVLSLATDASDNRSVSTGFPSASSAKPT
jgi:hypothetical protein